MGAHTRPAAAKTLDPPAPYKIATVSKLTSLSPQRLRAWERRYDLLRPQRGPGGHRLYGAEDLRLLRAVRELLDGGRTIGEISCMGRDALLNGPAEVPLSPAIVRQLMLSIVEAALRVDESALNEVLHEGFAALPAEEAIEGLIVGAQRRIGHLWERGRCMISSEHLATGIFVHRVRSLVEAATASSPPAAPRLVCACLPGERHELGLLVLAHSLALRGARVTLLGANVPFDDLASACRRIAPRAALLSVSTEPVLRASKAGLLEFRTQMAKEVPVFLGGCAAPAEDPDLKRASIATMPSSTPASETARSLLRHIPGPARMRKETGGRGGRSHQRRPPG